MMALIERSVVLPCEPERAFALFTDEASAWWPPGRRHTPDPASEIRMLATGRFWERAHDGHEVDLGRVKLWDPPRRLVLDFYIGTDAAHPTEVTVHFVPEANGTRVTVKHRPLPGSEDLWSRGAPAFERSWLMLLDALLRYGNKTVTIPA